MMRTCGFLAVLALTVAACGPGRPAPQPERWVVVQEGAGQLVSVNVFSIQTEPDDRRTATVAIAYASVQEKEGIRYDHENVSLRFDCRRGGMRREGGEQYLGEDLASAWMAGSPPIFVDGRDGREWEEVPPGTWLDGVKKLICRSEP